MNPSADVSRLEGASTGDVRPRAGHLVAGRRGERGAVLVHVAVAMMGLLAFSALTIDLGTLWVARGQAQNAADAGALAGAVALAYVNPTDTDAAQAAATAIVQQHQVWGQTVEAASLQTSAGACPAGSPATPGACLQVRVSRGTASGTPLPAFFSRLFGVNAADVTATASAKVMVGNAAPCVRPIAIVDRWNDRYDTAAPIDAAWTEDDFYDGYDMSGNPIVPPGAADTYTPPTPGGPGTGITVAEMVGQSITRIELDPSQARLRGDTLLSLDLVRPGFEGEDLEQQLTRYGANLESCSGVPMSIGATATVFHAHRTTYTVNPLRALIAQDPGATWDGRAVVNSAFNVSPRIITVAVIDPEVFSQQNRTGRLAAAGPIRNFVGFFVESAGGGSFAEVTGVVMPSAGRFDSAAPTVTDAAAFLRTVALVR
ncbi:MAG: pilus assembly protein TadG-related protein [Vicinamibacteraceae bacterium]